MFLYCMLLWVYNINLIGNWSVLADNNIPYFSYLIFNYSDWDENSSSPRSPQDSGQEELVSTYLVITS